MCIHRDNASHWSRVSLSLLSGCLGKMIPSFELLIEVMKHWEISLGGKVDKLKSITIDKKYTSPLIFSFTFILFH